jgi:hypothetical protein
MADPRNVAHVKKVQDKKKHHGEKVIPDAAEKPQPGRKQTLVQNDSPGGSYWQSAKHQATDVPKME